MRTHQGLSAVNRPSGGGVGERADEWPTPGILITKYLFTPRP